MTPTTADSIRPRATASARGGPRGGRSVAAQVKEQRRGYARAVVRSLARSQRGQPVAQVARVLRSALTPLGVRLSLAVLRDLAAGISAGNPVELP